jgi:hypothetical protein
MKTLETLPANNQAALSTPETLDLTALVKQVASRKVKGGIANAHSYVCKKGKVDLFSGVWAAYRSAKGIPKFDEHLKPTLATASEQAEINKAIESFWRQVNQEFMTFGEHHSSRRGGISGKLRDDGTAETWQSWKMERRQSAQDAKEKLFFAQQMLHRAKRRMDSMLDSGRYDYDQQAEQTKIINGWKAEVEKLSK